MTEKEEIKREVSWKGMKVAAKAIPGVVIVSKNGVKLRMYVICQRCGKLTEEQFADTTVTEEQLADNLCSECFDGWVDDVAGAMPHDSSDET